MLAIHYCGGQDMELRGGLGRYKICCLYPHTTAEHNVRSSRLQREPVCKPARHTLPTHSRLTKTDLTTDINTTLYPQANLPMKTDLTTDFDTTLYPHTNLLTKTDLTTDFDTTLYPQTNLLMKKDLTTDFDVTLYPQTNLLMKTDLTTDNTTPYPQTKRLKKTDLAADFNAISQMD